MIHLGNVRTYVWTTETDWPVLKKGGHLVDKILNAHAQSLITSENNVHLLRKIILKFLIGLDIALRQESVYWDVSFWFLVPSEI